MEKSSIKVNILGLTQDELTEAFGKLGLKRFVATQVTDWIYKKFVTDFSAMTNLSKENRDLLNEHFEIDCFFDVKKYTSSESAVKYVGKLHDGWFVEFVVLEQEGYNTLCVSSQCGCPVDCKFCLTGIAGFKRNLSVAEIVMQILYANRDGNPIRNLVFMGMGEPLLNYNHLRKAVAILTAPWGFDIGKRKFTISTSGFKKTIQQLIDDEWFVNLAFSVGSANPEKRVHIMPVEKLNPIIEVSQLIKKYQSMHNRQLTLEYTLLKGVNDREDDILALINLAKYLNGKINLINLNPHPKIPFTPVDERTIRAIQKQIESADVYVTIRYKKGQDVTAACGQLGESILKPPTTPA